jgi:hypothetical protein
MLVQRTEVYLWLDTLPLATKKVPLADNAYVYYRMPGGRCLAREILDRELRS